MTPDSDPIGLSPFSSPVSARNAVDRLVEETWSNHEKLGMIEGQVGGSPPMDDAELRAAGFAEMTNLNFRGSKMACVRAASKLVDLFASREQAVTVSLEKVPEALLSVKSALTTQVATAFSHFLREDCIHDLRIARVWECVTKGVGFAWFPDKDCPVPEFLPRSGVLVPPRAPADVKSWKICAVKQSMDAYEMFRILDLGGTDGWNRAAIRMAYAVAMQGQEYTDREFTESEVEACIKNRRQGVWDDNFSLNLYRIFVRNTEGKVDEFVVASDFETKEFLYRNRPEDAYKCFSEFLYPLRYSKFPKEYWDVEGLGHDIFDVQAVADRTQSGFVDYVDLAVRPIVSMPAGEVLGRSNVRVDRFIMVPSEQKIDTSMMKGDGGALLALNRMLGGHVDAAVERVPVNSAGETGSAQPISAAEAKMESIQYTEQNTVSAGFFYDQEDCLVEEILERAMRYTKSEVAKAVVEARYPEVVELHKALKKIPNYGSLKLTSEDAFEVSVSRAVGAGSQRDRRTALQVAFQNRGVLSPLGARRITKDFYLELLGPTAVEYVEGYDEDVFPSEKGHHPRYENAFFSLGANVAVADDDNHEGHIQGHTPFVQEIMQAGVQIEQQGGDLGRVLAALQAVAPHYSRHVDLFQLQANTEDLAARHKAYLQVAGEITNYLQRLTKNVTTQREAQRRQQAQQQVLQQKQNVDAMKTMETLKQDAAAAKDDSRRKDRQADAEIRRKDRKARADEQIQRAKGTA